MGLRMRLFNLILQTFLYTCTYTPADVDLERKLFDPIHANSELDEDTLQWLADAIGTKWALIVPLLFSPLLR